MTIRSFLILFWCLKKNERWIPCYLIFYHFCALSMQRRQVRKSVARTGLVWVELNRRGNEALRRVRPPPSRLCFLSIWKFCFKTSKPQEAPKDEKSEQYSTFYLFICLFCSKIAVSSNESLTSNIKWDVPLPDFCHLKIQLQKFRSSKIGKTLIHAHCALHRILNPRILNPRILNPRIFNPGWWRRIWYFFTASCLSGIDSPHNVISSRFACS